MEHKFSRIVIAGVGGVGWPLVVSLCQVLNGSIPITIYDDDSFEGGRGHTRFPHIFNQKLLKVDFLKAHIETIWRKRVPEVHAQKLGVADFEEGNWTGALFVDCTDMKPKDRKDVHAAAIAAGVTYMRVSYDGKVANVARGLPLLSTKAQDGAGGYLEPPDLPMSFAAGGWGAKFVLHALETGEVEEGELRVPVLVIEEKTHGVEAPTHTVVPSGEGDTRDSENGGLGDSGVGGSRKRRVGVDSSLSRRKRRKVVDDPR